MMTRVAALVIVVAVSAATQAEQGAPSAGVLAEMGLAGLQILSDNEASAIRGSGFEPGSHLVGFESYQLSKAEFAQHVADFRDRIDSHTFAGAAAFKKSKDNFQKHVTKFRAAVSGFQHRIH